MESADFCSQISTIPQYLGTCWFNAILMNSFYSQAMRKLMINKISKTWDKENKVLKFFKTILKKSYNTEDKKIIEMFYKTRPELLLITYANMFDKKIDKKLKKYDYGFINSYISLFLKKLNVKVLDIIYLNENHKYLLNIYKHIYNMYLSKDEYLFKIDKDKEKEEIKKILADIPDVLIIYDTKYDYNHNFFDKYEELYETDKNINIYKSDNYSINKEAFKDIKNNKEEIRFLGNKYKLDSIILNNYNYNPNSGMHAISGITCNNNKYIYNGWCKGTIDPALKIKEKKEILEPYPLVKFDWELGKDKKFCFKPEFSESINKDELCFSLDKGDKILIYVKNNKDEKSSLIKSKTYSDLSNKKKEFKEFYDDIKNWSYEKIIKYLNKKKIIFDRNLDEQILRKIYYYSLKKESGLLNKAKKYEYFTSLPIKDYNEEELIKIGNNYYLKNQLFYYLFILNYSESNNNLKKIYKMKTPDDVKIEINEIKQIIVHYFKGYTLSEIYYKFLINEEKLKNNIALHFENDIYIINSFILESFIIIYGINFIINILNLSFLKTTKKILLYIIDPDNKDEIINDFNELNLFTISSIDEFIKFLIDKTKNIVDNIPQEEQIELNSNIYNILLMFYYYVILDNQGISVYEKKQIIFKYYNTELDNYELLIQKVLEDKEEDKSNIFKNIKKIMFKNRIRLDNIIIIKNKDKYRIYKKINETTGLNLETNETEEIPIASSYKSTKGGKKKSLKKY